MCNFWPKKWPRSLKKKKKIEWWLLTRELLKQYLLRNKTVAYEVVAYGRWSLTRSGRYERVDCIYIYSHIELLTQVNLSWHTCYPPPPPSPYTHIPQRITNRPYTQPSCIIQNQPYWAAKPTVVHSEQNTLHQSSFIFLCFGCPTQTRHG